MTCIIARERAWWKHRKRYNQTLSHARGVDGSNQEDLADAHDSVADP
jgi:hypothetical protein